MTTRFDTQISNGSRVVKISQEAPNAAFASRLYVNDGQTATTITRKATTLKGAMRQAHEMLIEARNQKGVTCVICGESTLNTSAYVSTANGHVYHAACRD